MKRALILLTLLGAAAPSFAGDKESAAIAEYTRLSEELKRLAERNAWEGAERTYQDMLKTGASLSYEDHVEGAHAARALGDVSGARDRLLAANDIREEREVMDWLWEIDSEFGKVSLKCDPGALELNPAVMPFQPDRAAAVQFAQAAVSGTGIFEGYLPAGQYAFGRFEVRVVPRVQTVRIDARGATTVAQAKPEKKPKKPKKGDEEPTGETGTPVADGGAATPPSDADFDGPAMVGEPVEPEPVEPEPEPEVAETEPEPVMTRPQPEPEVAEPEPPPVEPEHDMTRPEPEPELEVADAEPEVATPAGPAPDDAQPSGPIGSPTPKPSGGGLNSDPYLFAGYLGVGNIYGGFVGGGVQGVLRPGSGAFGLSLGVGYDIEYGTPGFSAGARFYPHELFYLGAGVSPLIWYMGDHIGSKVAHGLNLQGGLELGFGPLLIDANVGVGAAPAVHKMRPAVSGGLGLGYRFSG